MNEGIKITRGELYGEVWAHPRVKLAKKYGISDVALAKRYRKRDIPLPGLGYWAKVQAGQKPRRKPLPRRDNDEVMTIRPYKERMKMQNKTVARKVASLRKDEEKSAPIVVPEKLLKSHPYIKTSRKYLRMRQSKEYPYRSDMPLKECLSIYVSNKQLRRAFLIIDTLIKEFEKRGFKMALLDGTGKESTAVIIMDEKVHFSIEELYERVLKPLPEGRKEPTPYDYVSRHSGRLKLKIEELSWGGEGLRKTWSDGKFQKVENILSEFIDGMIAVAGKLRERTLERQERERKAEEERRIREAAIKRYEAEEAKVGKLMSDMTKWNRSKQLRAYIRAVKKKRIITPEWIKWAYEQADRLDPLKESPPSILWVVFNENNGC